MKQGDLKIANNCLNTNIYPYLDTHGGQSSYLYLNIVHFSTTGLIRHLWQLQADVFLHWCLICAVILVQHRIDITGNFYNLGDWLI